MAVLEGSRTQAPAHPTSLLRFAFFFKKRVPSETKDFFLHFLTVFRRHYTCFRIASIEDPVVIKQILDHLERRASEQSLAFGHRRTQNARRVSCRHDVGATPQARVQSFCVLLTPLTYIPVGHVDIDISAGKPICTVADCREAGGDRDVPNETCEVCGSAVKVIACIEDPAVVQRILAPLNQRAIQPPVLTIPPARAPPQSELPSFSD